MDVALAECREGCKSVADAARDNDVPISTLRDRLRGKIFNQVDNMRIGEDLLFLLASFF